MTAKELCNISIFENLSKPLLGALSLMKDSELDYPARKCRKRFVHRVPKMQ